ncbi:MAG: CBS domain-containing protein [Polyangiaceae bacterium]|nr:CBS domain-containing protein [Polyangiaceae bacterium]
MSLERFLYGRLVVMRPNASAFDAARAMVDNRIGCVLVADRHGLLGILTDRDLMAEIVASHAHPRDVPVGDIMTEDVHALPVDARIEDVARTMQEARCRRVPIVDRHGKPIGIVTLDDLLVEGILPPRILSDIVRAQLSLPSRNKARGPIHPGRIYDTVRDPIVRSAARADATYTRFLDLVGRHTGLEEPGPVDRVIKVVFGAICRRITPDLARHFLSQLPLTLKEHIFPHLDGPDRRITTGRLEREIESALGVHPLRAREILEGVITALTTWVSPGQLETVRGQLPEDFRIMFPRIESDRRREVEVDMTPLRYVSG